MLAVFLDFEITKYIQSANLGASYLQALPVLGDIIALR